MSLLWEPHITVEHFIFRPPWIWSVLPVTTQGEGKFSTRQIFIGAIRPWQLNTLPRPSRPRVTLFF